MWKTAILCGLTLSQAVAGADLVSAVVYDAPVAPHARLPIYDNGYLMVTYGSGDSAITVYGPDGTRLFDALVKVPHAGALQVGNSAADTDGTIAAAVAYAKPEGYAGAVALFNRDGRQVDFYETGLYLPTALAFGPDHALWALGWQRDAEHNDRADAKDYRIFRKFSRGGQEAGAYLPRSSFPAGLEPGRISGGEKGMRIAHGRVGALVNSGKAGDQREWVELDLNGALVGRWRMDHMFAANLGFTSGGALYGNTPYEKPPVRLTVFDRAAANWQPVPGDIRSGWVLMGADGDNLVLWDQDTSPMLLRYVRPAPSHP